MSITTNVSHCWIVVNADGTALDDEFEPHHASEQEAMKAAANLRYENEPAPVAKQLDHLCSEASTVCGYRYDEDDEGVQHWPDGAEAFQRWLVAHADYRLGSDGSLLCPLDHDCDECNAVALVFVPVEVPGQMSIGEVGA